ncbi:MAG: molybdopterin-synthase adenylyltransferase [Candidatus Woesearchaeota archaeon]|nr:molybdopterin-synthase adenylyltransferase [Candidatus Woesearchaeota archaeon]
MLDLEEFHKRTSKVFDIEKFKDKTVAVVGCGGVGSFSAEFLARAGITNLVLIDFDKADLSNLARQNYVLDDLNESKVIALKKRILKINPQVKITVFNQALDQDNAKALLNKVDILLSAVDSFKTKKEINQICKELGIPFFHASAFKQNAELLFVTKDSACLECVYPNINESPEKPEEVGVTPAVPTIVGLMAANMILNYLANKISYENILFRFDFKTMDFHKIKIKKRKDCRVCNALNS